MPVGEKECTEEQSGCCVTKRQKGSRDQKARRTVRVGESVHGAANIVKRLSLATLADDHVGLVERLVPVEWNSQERELVLVLHVRIVTDPGRVELAGKQQRRDLLVRPTLQELNGPAEPSCEI